MAGILQTLTGNLNRNPNFNICVLTAPNSQSIQFYDYTIKYSTKRINIVTPIIDKKEPNVEKVSQEISRINISGNYNPLVQVYSSSGVPFNPVTNPVTDEEIRQNVLNFLGLVDSIIINPKDFFLLGFENTFYNEIGIRQLTLDSIPTLNQKKGNNLVEYSFDFLNIQTFYPGATQMIP